MNQPDMYKGGKMLQFHPKTIDVLLFDVFVSEKFRRQGMCEYIVQRSIQVSSQLDRY